MIWLLAVALAAEPRETRAGTLRFPQHELYAAEALPAVVERLRGDEDPAVRAALAEIVARSGETDLVADLLAEETEPEVRIVLLAGLRGGGRLDAVAAALGDRHGAVRAVAASTAGYRADGATLAPELIARLKDPEPEVRAMAARALGWLGVAGARGALEARLADPSAPVRLQAVSALGRLGGSAAVGRLASDPDPGVAAAARRVAGL